MGMIVRPTMLSPGTPLRRTPPVRTLLQRTINTACGKTGRHAVALVWDADAFQYRQLGDGDGMKIVPMAAWRGRPRG